MRTTSPATTGGGTAPDLIEVASWRAHFEIHRALCRGEPADRARVEVILRFRADLEAESFGDYADEALMAALQRGVEDALTGG